MQHSQEEKRKERKMNRADIIAEIREKRSLLCVGLDSDPLRLPHHLPQSAEGVWVFNKKIIEATAPYTVAYKPNAAFYEAMGATGWQVLEETIRYIKERHPECFVILDAKRGDIGNTSSLYARAAFEQMGADALTIAPYMGEDSVKPFLAYDGKWAVLLALTSNKGANNFQQQRLESGQKLYESVLQESQKWGTPENMMYVCGATQAEYFQEIRHLVPEHFLLVPGVGAQGGSLSEVCRHGLTRSSGGLLINSSRGIIFASSGEDFGTAAAAVAREMQTEMAHLLKSYTDL